MDQVGRLPEIDRAAVEPLVRRALGSAIAVVEGWRVGPLGGDPFDQGRIDPLAVRPFRLRRRYGPS